MGWFSLANAEHSVYLPMNSLVTEMEEAYTRDTAESPRYDPFLASVKMKRLCALAEQDRQHLGRPVRAAFRKLEEAAWLEAAAVNTQAVRYLEAGNRTAAERLWTDFARAKQKAALNRADSLFEEILWYLMDTTDSIDYDYSWRTMERTPREKRLFEPSGSR